MYRLSKLHVSVGLFFFIVKGDSRSFTGYSLDDKDLFGRVKMSVKIPKELPFTLPAQFVINDPKEYYHHGDS